MIFSLDIKTMIFVLLLGHLFTVILITAYSYKHPKNRPIKLFVMSKSLQLIALVLIVLRDLIPYIWSVVISNTLILIGAAIECSALLLLINAFNRLSKKVYVILTITMVIAFYAISIFKDLENLRIAWISLAFVIFSIFPINSFSKIQNSSVLQKTIRILYMFVMLAFLFRALAALLILGSSMTMFSQNVFQTLSFIAMYLELLVGSIGFVLLAKEQIDIELHKMANTDDLTTIYNRRAFITKAIHALATHAKKKLPVSFVLFDIDYFKNINDTLGHDIGDKVLQHIVTIINAELRENSLFGRYGGDEFAILLQSIDETQSNEIIENIRQKVEHYIFPDTDLQCTLSLGVISVIPNTHTNIDILYKLADKALYEAKQQGRNKITRAFL